MTFRILATSAAILRRTTCPFSVAVLVLTTACVSLGAVSQDQGSDPHAAISYPSSQDDAPDPVAAHEPAGIEGGISKLFAGYRSICRIVWHEWGWFLIPFLVVLAIKKFLLRQSFREIVACTLEVIAFLLLHAIELVRYAAIQLRLLARALREAA